MLLNILGLLGILLFCVCVIALAGATTWLVVRLSPPKSKKPKPAAES